MIRFIPLFLIACTPSNNAPTVDDTGAPTGVATQLAEYLSGEFSSNAQSLDDPTYYDIRLSACAISAPELGDEVLYVEQAVAGSESQPYRQRLYVIQDLEPNVDGNPRGQSVVYELSSPSDFVGGCEDGGGWTVEADAAILRTGCEVVLSWYGEHFSGGTVEDNCISDLYGASYATSEVQIYNDRIESWDRGWYSDDTHAWGATAGPYIFDRTR